MLGWFFHVFEICNYMNMKFKILLNINNYIFKIIMVVMCFFIVSHVYAVDKKDRENINDLLSVFGSNWSGGLEELEKYFEVTIEKHVGDYVLIFVLKSPPRIKYEVYLEGKTGGMGEGRHEYPDGPECSMSDLNHVDKIMKKEKNLWMIGPVDGALRRFDVSRGYKSLLKQNVFYFYSQGKNNLKLRTRKYKNYAVLYYYDDSGGIYDPFTNIFSIWIDLKKEVISGAAWVELSASDGKLLSLNDFRFINNSLRENGNFGVKGSVTEGLISLMKNNEVKLQLHPENNMWHISVLSETDDENFIKFNLSAVNGDISEVVVSGRSL